MRYDAAVEKARGMGTWARTYKGQVPRDLAAPTPELHSRWDRDKDDMEFQLKVEAAFQGFDLLFDLWFEKDSDTEASDSGKGVYRFTVWRAHARASRAQR